MLTLYNGQVTEGKLFSLSFCDGCGRCTHRLEAGPPSHDLLGDTCWAAVQGIGTILAAVAAIIALVIAGKQLGELTASNRLLAASNAAMTESNAALTRPYIVVDFEFSVSGSRSGGSGDTSVFAVIKNDGRMPAHNVTMTADHPFEPLSEPDTEG